MEHSSLDIRQNVPLAPFTTLKIGGPAKYFVEVATEGELVAAVTFARQNNLPIFVLGGGSNLLVSDSGFAGLVIHLTINGAIDISINGDRILYAVPAGVEWDSVVLSTCEQGLSGIECLAGIPGYVGGTPVQNVGAYGQEVSQTIGYVRALDLEKNTFVDIPKSQCGFSYRRSIFNSTAKGRYIVTLVNYEFDPLKNPSISYADIMRYFKDFRPSPIEVYRAVREIRQNKGMLIVPGDSDARSAGSFFKNPIVPRETLPRIASALNLSEETIPHYPASEGSIKLPAAWLLERAGFVKGFSMGNVGISSKHTLAIINRGGGTASDVFALREAIQAKVKTLFGIDLEQEPVQLGS